MRDNVNSLIQALTDDDRQARIVAVKALGKLKDPRAIDPLIRALSDKNSEVRAHAIEALGEIGDPRAAEPLAQALMDKDTRGEAAKALAKIGKPAINPLIQALKDEKIWTRRLAAWALGEIKDPRALDSLMQAFKDEDTRIVRIRAEEALGKIKNSRAVEPLIQALKDEDYLDPSSGCTGSWRD